MENRRMCPNCRAFITMKDRVCPYCEAQLGPRAVDMRPSQGLDAFIPQANMSAIIVLVVNIVFYVGQQLAPHLTSDGIEYAPLIFLGQWWRLITAGFLHGGIWHILMNSWSLWILVTEAEYFYGTSRMAVAYVVSTITGFLMAAVTAGQIPVLGASCAVFGLMGAMLAIGLRNRADPLSQAVRSHYGTWLIFGAVMSFASGVSWQGHLGGFLGGLTVGFIAGLPALPGTPKETFWKFAGIASVLLVALAWFEALTHPVPIG